MVICLFVHPVLLEVGEASSRGTKSDGAAHRVRIGDIATAEEATECIVESSLYDASFKVHFLPRARLTAPVSHISY